MARRPRNRRERLRDNIQARIDKANAGGGGPPPIINEPAPGTTGGNEMLMPATIPSSWINPSRENVGTGLSRGPNEPDSGAGSGTGSTFTGSSSSTTNSSSTDELSTVLSPYVKNFDTTGTTQDNTGSTSTTTSSDFDLATGANTDLLSTDLTSIKENILLLAGGDEEVASDLAGQLNPGSNDSLLPQIGDNSVLNQVLETTSNVLDSAEEKTNTLLTATTTATTEAAGSLGETVTGTSDASQITANPEDLGEVATTGMETLTGNIDAGVENINRAVHTGVESLNTFKDDVISTANDVKDFVLDPFGTINRAYTEGVENTNVWFDQVGKIWDMATGGGGGVTDNVPQVDSELMSQASSVATRSGGFWDESQGGGGGAQSFIVQRRRKGPETLLTRGQTRGKIKQRMMAA